MILAVFTAVSAQTLDKAKLDQFFDRLAEKNKAMGSLTIARDGNVLYTRAIGYSQINGSRKETFDRGDQIPGRLDHKNVHRRDDLSARRGRKIKAVGHARQILPADSERRKITIAHILAHRSGIHDFIREPDFRTWSLNPRTKDETLAFIAKGTPDFEPDEKRNYSNAGYVLLGFVVEKLDRQTLSGRPKGKNHFEDRAEGYLSRHRKNRYWQKRKFFLQLRRRLETGRPKSI